MEPSLRILIVDDTELNLKIAEAFVQKMGHQAIVAHDGFEALQRFDEHRPDVVLMDVMMPGLDGFETTRRLKAKYPDTWIPVIFLTALTDEANFVRGLAEGGDDYLYKPVNFTVLRAKIGGFARTLRLQRQIEQNNRELLAYRDRAEQENGIAGHLMARLVNRKNLEALPWLGFFSSPAADFSGDLVAAERTPGDAWNLLLADGTGHGLTAALSVLPLVAPFYAMTRKGFEIGSIALQSNHIMRSLLPTERFAAVVFVSINPREQIIQVWNGGMPPLYLLNQAGGVAHVFKSRQLPLGVLDSAELTPDCEKFFYQEPLQLVVCSDGLVEAENSAGDAFGYDRMVAAAGRYDPAALKARVNRISGAVADFLAGRSAADDITLLVADCPLEVKDAAAARDVLVSGEQADQSPWRAELWFGWEQLRRLDAVPLLHNLISQLEVHPAKTGEIFLVLAELFNNALDHGLLGLDSSLKNGEDGMERYYQARQATLQSLTSGQIRVALERAQLQGQARLTIRVVQSGVGFDHAKVLSQINTETGVESRPHGRGLGLVKSLAHSLTYADEGREAIAVLIL